MAQLARAAGLAKHQLAVDHHAAAHTRAEGEHDEVLHALGAAIDQLAVGGGVGVVRHHHRHVDMRPEERLEVDDALEVEVGSVLDASRVVVAHRSRDADAFDALNAVFLHQQLDLIVDVSHVEVGVKILVGREVFLGHAAAVVAHQSDVGVGAANVDTYGISVHFLRFLEVLKYGFLLKWEEKRHGAAKKTNFAAKIKPPCTPNAPSSPSISPAGPNTPPWSRN